MREYKFSIVFCILLIFSSEAISAGDGDCKLSHNDGTELTEMDWNKGITLPPINDSESMNINLLKLQVENGVTLYDFNVNGQTSKLYLHSLMKDKYLSINTGKEFGKYEEFETDTNLVIKSYFLCPNEGKKELVVIQPIIDTNNHPPVFSKPEYKFVLSMPLENGLELDFSEELVVRDVDLTNSLITFKISENEELAKKLLFKTPGRDSKNPKNYVTKLILPELVDLNENVTFTLHATDSGIPARSTTTKVTIVIDKTNTPPRFNSSLYTADLMSLDSQNFNGVKLNFLQSDVILRHVYGSIEKLEITGTSLENKNHFRVTHGDITTNNDVEISIELSYLSKRLLSQSVISMNLTATVNKMNVNTTLHIILPALQDQAENDHKVIVIILENLTFGYFSAVTTLSIFMTALLSYLFLKHYRNNRRTPTLVEDFINPDTKTGLPK